MGVDVSVDRVVGVILELDGIKALPDYELYGTHEALEVIFADKGWWGKGLEFGIGGSYYESDNEHPWIGLSRLTDSFGLYDIPGGILGKGDAKRPEITDDEKKLLKKAAKKLGTPKPKVEAFTSVLWH